MEIHNELTKQIEEIMKDYGGNKWSKMTLSDFSDDVIKRVSVAESKLKGPQKLVCINLIKKLKKQTSIQDQLLVLNEVYFSLVQPESE